jgi:hypothetical protein
VIFGAGTSFDPGRRKSVVPFLMSGVAMFTS